jgi:hypothetical protein
MFWFFPFRVFFSAALNSATNVWTERVARSICTRSRGDGSIVGLLSALEREEEGGAASMSIEVGRFRMEGRRAAE